jgi:hypothetical protein
LKGWGRIVGIGFVCAILIWLGIVLWMGYRLNSLDGDGTIIVGWHALPLAVGSALGDTRQLGVRPLGYVVLLAPGIVLTGIELAGRRRARRAGQLRQSGR